MKSDQDQQKQETAEERVRRERRGVKLMQESRLYGRTIRSGSPKGANRAIRRASASKRKNVK